jgi:hypothetical protein
MKTSLLAGAWDCSSRSTRAASAQKNFVSFVARFGSDVVVLAAASAQAGKASVACATTMRDVLGARQVTAACFCDHVEPHAGDWNRFRLTLCAPSPLPIALH